MPTNYIDFRLDERVKAVAVEMRDELVPAIHLTLFHLNPEEFVRRGGSCCRQIAVLGKDWLARKLPEISWQAWEGDFDGTFRGQSIRYDHAWIYGVGENGVCHFVDFSHRKDRRLWRIVERNEYPPELCNGRWQEASRRLIPANVIDRCEYYTGLRGYTILKIVRTRIGMQCGHPFDESWYEDIRPADVD